MTTINNEIGDLNINRFSHYAMNTIFEILINDDDKEYAEQAANAAFKKIDGLEDDLSRFKPNSEVAQINSLQKGEVLKLNQNIFECLNIANHIYKITNGIFDVTAGNIIDLWKNGPDEKPENISDFGMNKIILDETNFTITLLSDNLTIDLGGIGKGYAIDQAIELLSEWEINNALIHSGSTVKAIGKFAEKDGWPVTISNPLNNSQTITEILLQNSSLSGSGKQKGTHIINPFTSLPIKDRSGAWAISESAAISDAMSTAFMIMHIKDIPDFYNTHKEISGLVIKNEKNIIENDNLLVSDNFL